MSHPDQDNKKNVDKSKNKDIVNAIKQSFTDKLLFQQGCIPALATLNDHYLATSFTLRDQMMEMLIQSLTAIRERHNRVVCYMSAEFLLGPHLENNLLNLNLYEEFQQAIEEMGLDLRRIIDHEEEPGLGNGGLGRLAACYLDSLASMEVPTVGYGIRYEFGMFDQVFANGWQKEISDRWLQFGNPWEFRKTERAVVVRFSGSTEHYQDDQGRHRVRWIPGKVVKGVPYDTPITGYRTKAINILRLWSAEAPESFDFEEFNVGDYIGAVEEKIQAESISKVLYPNDSQYSGKMLRLAQQYFFVACSLQDMITYYLLVRKNLDDFHRHFAVQLNDTHPAIAVPELMRLLMDVHLYGWDQAWDICTGVFAYTNHTLLPEALETWPVQMMASMLPRHLEIIYEINQRFLDQVRQRYPGNEDIVRRMSIIDESGERSVRMAHLACIGSYRINGVAELHTRLLKEHTLADFHRFWPEKIINVTNGVTPRRWLRLSNPRLSQLISSAIGEQWITDLDELKKLEPFAEDSAFREKWRQVKLANKENFCTLFSCDGNISFYPDALYDVQVKRIHEYKRQHLNLLHIISLYWQLKNTPQPDLPPRIYIFGGKAAPGYFMAKLIIKLINSVARVINQDPAVNRYLQVHFVPNFNVQNGQLIYPMADLSEQISLAGKEASGTGNMKFSMNGALTIGTMDGANVEIREQVGAENFFLFGMNVEEVRQLREKGYDPQAMLAGNEELCAVINLIATGHFSHGDRELFRPLLDSLRYSDPYMVIADFQSYADCQKQVGQMFCNTEHWAKMSILNVSRIGKFSSDRSIAEYCSNIWKIDHCRIRKE